MNAIFGASGTDLMQHCVIGEDYLTRQYGEDEVESALRCILVNRQADKAQLAAQVAIEVSLHCNYL